MRNTHGSIQCTAHARGSQHRTLALSSPHVIVARTARCCYHNCTLSPPSPHTARYRREKSAFHGFGVPVS
eukprot:2634309-Rhodomonas_salina.1